MPNSRIEAAFFVSDEIIEGLGAWTTDGNTLIGGGGDLLGSIDNFGFFFITNSVARGGFLNTGEFFLQQSSSSPNHRFFQKVIQDSTLDALDYTAFSFALPDNTTFKFDAMVQYRSSGGADWGGFERKVMAQRTGTSSISGQTFSFTEREGDAGVNARWNLSGNNIQLLFNGIAGTVQWSAVIKYQGVLNL